MGTPIAWLCHGRLRRTRPHLLCITAHSLGTIRMFRRGNPHHVCAMYSNVLVYDVILDYETFHHHVVIGPLTPDTTYYYKVGDGDGGYSQEFKFRSAPLSSKNMNLTFAVFADLGMIT